MQTTHHSPQTLQRLLERGYSAEDLRITLDASEEQLERALSRQREARAQRQRERNLHNQATYAMGLRAR